MWLRATLKQSAVAVQLAVAMLSSCNPEVKPKEKSEPVAISQSCDSCAFSLIPAPYTSFGGPMPVGEPIIDSAVVIQIGAGRTEEDLTTQRNFMKQKLQKFPDVTLADSVPNAAYLVFSVNSQTDYIVEIARLYERQGWLLFTPGKDPVYCPRESVHPGCNDSALVSCYFGQ